MILSLLGLESSKFFCIFFDEDMTLERATIRYFCNCPVNATKNWYTINKMYKGQLKKIKCWRNKLYDENEGPLEQVVYNKQR
jgi:hypothetical protein